MKYRIISFTVSLLMPLAIVAFIILSDYLSDIRYYLDLDYNEIASHVFRWLENALSFAGLFVLPVLMGWFIAKMTQLPDKFFPRFLPLLIPVILWLAASIPLLRIFSDSPLFYATAPTIFLSVVYLLYYTGFAVTSRRKQPSIETGKGVLQLAGIICAALLAAGINLFLIIDNTIFTSEFEADASVGHRVYEWDYFPFAEDHKLVSPDHEPSLKIYDNHPRLDGAIALLPVYGAISQAVYAGLDTRPFWEWQNDEATATRHIYEFIDCTNTPTAWQRLVDDEVDIFFGVTPSERQLKTASEAGLEPVITPIARDAFVFMVNAENPVNDLSTAQIQDIYSKRITSWEDLGGPDERILAFQRPAGSGSQTTMEETVMAGKSMGAALREERVEGMGDIINAVAEYRNRKEAIGYTFRWYATVQFSSDQIKFLSVNGVEPAPENISNEKYPFTTPFVAVTCRPLSKESKALLDWILSPEGQALVAKTGYVPVN